MNIIAPGTKHIERRLKTSSPVGLLIGLLLFTTVSNAEEIVLRPSDQSTLGDQPITLTGGTKPPDGNSDGTPGDSLEIQAGFILQPTTGHAVIVDESGYKNLIKNAGSIKTISEQSSGILSRGSDTTITNEQGGIIDTQTSEEGHGIVSSNTAKKAQIFNAGLITTAGKDSKGVASYGIAATITNKAGGKITIKGEGSYGIYSGGRDAVIINEKGATIETQANGSDAVSSWGRPKRFQISNAGLIKTAGEESYGIYSDGSDAVITNEKDGTIETQGNDSHGIISSAKARIFNAGLITTAGDRSNGIYSEGIDAVITNQAGGTIKTQVSGSQVSGSHGIFSSNTAKKAQISNAGLITTAGEKSYGIYSEGIDATITNQAGGTIETQVDRSHAIFSSNSAEKAKIFNAGLIKTAGKESHGIYSEGSGATITNEQGGIIETQRASGIVVSGAINRLINRGSISAALGATSYAILGTAGATGLTLEIEAGSRIIGKIDLGGSADGDTVRISDDGQRHLVIDNVEQVQFSEAIKSYAVYSTVGKTTTIRILNPATVEVSRGRALSVLSGALQRVSQQRLDHSRALGLTLSSARHFQARAPLAWGQVFGSSESVDAKGEALAYELSQQGFSLGYERDYQGRRLGLLGGVAITNSESDIESFEQKTTSTYFGAYAHFNLGDFNLATALIAGIDGHDTERFFQSSLKATAKADFSGWFLSPSVSLSSVYDLNDQLELRPSLRLGYSLASQSKYTESGSEINLTVKSRSLSALTAQLQVAAVYHLNPGMDLTAHLGFGSSSRTEGKIETSLGAKSFSFAPFGESIEGGLIAGLGLRTSLNERLNLAAGIESNVDRLNYQLSLAYSF